MSGSRLDELRKFVVQDPGDPFGHYAVALEYVSMQKFPEAVQAFRDLIGLDPNYVPAYHQLGLLYGRLNQKDEARKTFEVGIRIAGLAGDTHAQGEMQESTDELE